MKISRIVVAALAVTLVAASGASGTGPGATYGARVAVGMARAEPRIAIGPDGALYTAAAQPLGRDSVFKSTNGGGTWAELAATNLPFGGGDDDVMVSRKDNILFVAGQEPGELCESVSRGPNGGATVFITNPVPCNAGILDGADRPWLASTESGPNGLRVYLYYNQGGTHVVYVSDRRGLTWAKAGSFAGRFPGNLVVDETSKLLYAITTVRTSGVERVVMYRSSLNAKTWTPTTIATLTTGDKGLNHVFLAKDTAGNLYTAWTDDPDAGGMRVWFSRSVDHGTSWSAPAVISSNVGTDIFPAIAAGSPGRVAVVWYESDVVGDPNTMAATAAWHVGGASTVDGGATWDTAPPSTLVNHHGVLCTKGASCSSGRRLLDFISVAVDTAGRANAVWADDNTPGIDAVVGPVEIFFARSDAAMGTGVH